MLEPILEDRLGDSSTRPPCRSPAPSTGPAGPWESRDTGRSRRLARRVSRPRARAGCPRPSRRALRQRSGCAVSASRCSGRQRRTATSPRVIAPRRERMSPPRSGRQRPRARRREALPTPSTAIVAVPSPAIRAPIARRSRARSTTSGSRAAFSSTVVPRARVAASIAFSVPVTVTVSKTILAPREPARPSPRRTRARARPRRPASRTPPGGGRSAERRSRIRPAERREPCPLRAKSGPSTRTEARIVLTRSYGASAASISRASIVASPGRAETKTPMCASSFCIVRMSRTSGRFVRRTGSAVSSAAARQGRAAFFAPEASTSPASRAGPSMRTCPRADCSEESWTEDSSSCGRRRRGECRSSPARCARSASGGAPRTSRSTASDWP